MGEGWDLKRRWVGVKKQGIENEPVTVLYSGYKHIYYQP